MAVAHRLKGVHVLMEDEALDDGLPWTLCASCMDFLQCLLESLLTERSAYPDAV